MSPRRFRPGLTLIELVVVLAITAIVIAVTIEGAVKISETAALAQCLNNLKQIGLAVHQIEAVGRNGENRLPALTNDNAVANSWRGDYSGGILLTLLPEIEQGNLYYAAVNGLPTATWAAPPPGHDFTVGSALTFPEVPVQAYKIKAYNCPYDDTIESHGWSKNQTTTDYFTTPQTTYPWGASSYSANYRLFGVVNNVDPSGQWISAWRNNSFGPSHNLGNLPNGTGNTVMFGEQFGACTNTAGNLWAFPGLGNYSNTCYSDPRLLIKARNPTGPGIQEAPVVGGSNSQYWAPVFANNDPHFGFTASAPIPALPLGQYRKTGSIYEYNNQYGNPPQGAPGGYKQITATTPGFSGLGQPNFITPPWDAAKVFPNGGILAYWDAPPQGGATQATCDKSRLQSFHRGVVNVCVADGSARVVSTAISQPIWYAVINVYDKSARPGNDW